MDTTTNPDVIELIRQQHTTIRQLFTDLEQAPPAERNDKFEPLVRLLAVHETAEEEIVYPSLKTLGDAATKVVEERKKEEDEAKKVLAGLEKKDPSSPEFLEEIKRFHTAVETHATHEEAEVLPLIARTDQEHREAMGQLFMTAEAMAPTHAHKMAPESSIGNILVGPFVAMVDRVRDAIHDRQRQHQSGRR
jgi:hemerythrin superfamily protein